MITGGASRTKFLSWDSNIQLKYLFKVLGQTSQCRAVKEQPKKKRACMHENKKGEKAPIEHAYHTTKYSPSTEQFKDANSNGTYISHIVERDLKR